MAAKRGVVTVVGIAPWGQEAGINAVDPGAQREDPARLLLRLRPLPHRPCPSWSISTSPASSTSTTWSSATTTLDQINEAYADLDRGEIGRGAIMFD